MASLRIAVISKLSDLASQVQKLSPKDAPHVRNALPNIKWSDVILGQEVPPFKEGK